jgi:Zn-dependent protease with chaperone function
VNRTIAIGLGAGVVGVLGTIVLDQVTHGALHTVLSAVMIVVLITAALLLHHVARQTELSARRQIRETEDEAPPPSNDPNTRST